MSDKLSNNRVLGFLRIYQTRKAARSGGFSYSGFLSFPFRTGRSQESDIQVGTPSRGSTQRLRTTQMTTTPSIQSRSMVVSLR